MSKKYWKLLYQKNKEQFDIVHYNKLHPQLDEFSPFRVFTKRVHQSDVIAKYGQSNLDLPFLKNLWEKQRGCCVYTGIKMVLPKSMWEYRKIHSIKKVSLDRIDSSIGYVRGNVHFVCQGINLAKKNLSNDDMISFIKEIKNAEISLGVDEIGGDEGSRTLVIKTNNT